MERAGEGQGQHGKKSRRLVLFPTPLQGHITPILQLASLLHSRGFSITILHTDFNSPDPSNYPDFSFESISDGLSDQQSSSVDFMALSSALNLNCETPFRDCLTRLLSENTQDRIACIIDDGVMQFVQSISDELKVPRFMLEMNSIASFVAYAAFPLLKQKGYIPVKDPMSKTPVFELPPFRIKDIPEIKGQGPDDWYDFVVDCLKRLKSSTGIIWNSFDYLEQTSLEKLRQDFQLPIFPIGPLHRYSSGSSTTLLMQDQSCIKWLDNQTPKSVIYVSFGSLVAIEKTELIETAWGLANSMQPFLWVIRPGSVHGLEWAELPDDFEERVSGRGLIVKWAPQQEVLAHTAVGGFWTHSGWNSTLESICEGVPMLCWPFLGDQKVNARLVSHVWKVGLQLENGLERDEIERAVRRLMQEKEGEELRERIKILKENTEICLRKGGSSYDCLNSLVNYIMSL